MALFVDGCRFNPTLGGTTDWTYSSAVTGYQGPAAANLLNGILYKYRAESADLSQWEFGEGAYNSTTRVVARTTVLSNSSGTGTLTPGQSGAGTKINFSTVPQVAIVALAEDMPIAGQIPGILPFIVTVTMTIASPSVFTISGGGIVTPNAPVVLQDNGDTYPAGFTKGTTYYIVGNSITASGTFTLATSVANAKAGTAINGTGSQSGTHTAVINAGAQPGCIGEYIEYNTPSTSPITVVTNTDTGIISGAYPAGIWLLQANITYIPSAGGTFTEIHQDISIAAASLEAPPAGGSSSGSHNSAWIAGDGHIRPTGCRVFVFYQSFTTYAVTHMTITAGTMGCYGKLWGVRIA